MPKGLARSIRAWTDKNPATAVLVDAFLKKSLLEIADIHASLHVEFGWSTFSRATVLSHNIDPLRGLAALQSGQRFVIVAIEKQGLKVAGQS